MEQYSSELMVSERQGMHWPDPAKQHWQEVIDKELLYIFLSFQLPPFCFFLNPKYFSYSPFLHEVASIQRYYPLAYICV